jgi:hypothetical protein
MVTDGEAARGLTIPFAAIANSIALKKRSDELGAQLDAALQGYDRYETLYQALVNRFKKRSPGFALTESRAPSQFLADKSIKATAADQGYDYVITIEDKFSGLSMLHVVATKTDDLAPLTTLGFQVYDARKRSRIAKGVISANGLKKLPYTQAVHDRDLFVTAYGEIADSLANQVVGTLFRTDQLHAMAESAGRGNEVPQVSAVLKRFEKRFDYRFQPAPEWKRTRMTSKYINVLEPKSDLRFSLGLRFEVDLLIAELGQDVTTLDEYVSVYLTRLSDGGIGTATFAEFPDIQAPPGYRAYSFNLGENGGRQIVLLRLLNADMVEMVSVVCLKDFDRLYSGQRAAIERMIADAKLDVS